MRTIVRTSLDFVGIICTLGSQWLRKNEAARDLTLDTTTTGISRRPLPSWRPLATDFSLPLFAINGSFGIAIYN